MERLKQKVKNGRTYHAEENGDKNAVTAESVEWDSRQCEGFFLINKLTLRSELKNDEKKRQTYSCKSFW